MPACSSIRARELSWTASWPYAPRAVLISHTRHHVGHQFQHRSFLVFAQLRIRLEQALPRLDCSLTVALSLQLDHAEIEERICIFRVIGECLVELGDRSIDVAFPIEA